MLRSAATDPPDHFIVDVVALEGLLEGARRAAVHRRVTEAFQAVFGEAAHPLLPFRVWVLVHDVREGGWGAGGGTVSALDVAQFINPRLDAGRRAEIAASIARPASLTEERPAR